MRFKIASCLIVLTALLGSSQSAFAGGRGFSAISIGGSFSGGNFGNFGSIGGNYTSFRGGNYCAPVYRPVYCQPRNYGYGGGGYGGGYRSCNFTNINVAACFASVPCYQPTYCAPVCAPVVYQPVVYRPAYVYRPVTYCAPVYAQPCAPACYGGGGGVSIAASFQFCGRR